MTEIKLENSTKTTLVDDADAVLVSQYKWFLVKSKKHEYAITYKPEKIYMHKLLLNRRGYNLVDHKDNNGLNNQRDNIRPCSYAQNQFNQIKHTGTSKYKGVYFHASRGKWMARIKFNYKDIYLGYFLTELEAAQAYDLKAKELFKEYARPNF